MGTVGKGVEKMKKLTITVILFLLFFGGAVYGYDNKITHRQLTKRTIDSSVLSSYLKNNLGLQEGSSSTINGRPVDWWLMEGAYLEDLPICRSTSHFHNPLDPWDLSYMSDEPWYVNLWCNATGFSTRYSNVTWGTGYLSPNGPTIGRINQQMGWDNAKNDYYIALTSVFSENRETYLAKTFQALGQVLHLLQDVSVPAHVRNDFRSHLEFIGFQSIVPTTWFGNLFEHYVMNHPGFVSIQSDPPSFTNARVTDFWDTDQFTRGDPPPTNVTLGLAELTNANYFSDSTIPNNHPGPEHWFTYPMLTSTNYLICGDYAPNSNDIVRYISRKQCPPLSQDRSVDHFAALSLLNEEPSITDANIPFLRLELDDNVHNTYAKELVPLAVSYSAALLNYFFRSSIEITLPPKGVYAQTENRDQGFTRVTLLARNTTPGEEEMTDGSIELVVRYRLAQEDPFQSYPVPTTWEYSYLVVPELNGLRSIPRANPLELVFDLSQNPIPINATDIYLQVVYRGRLGQEDGAVAVGMRDISEPTPIDLYNDMDRVCINGNWYVAGSPEAIAQVDTNNDGIADLADVYAHHLRDIYIRFSPATDPKYASSTDYNLRIPSLSAGESYIRRAFILSDYQFNYGDRVSQVLNTDPNDRWVNWYDPAIIPYTGLKNQTELATPEICAALNLGYPCDIRYYPIFNSYRGVEIWDGVIFENRPYPPGSSCP